jgi:hypothetical protein
MFIPDYRDYKMAKLKSKKDRDAQHDFMLKFPGFMEEMRIQYKGRGISTSSILHDLNQSVEMLKTNLMNQELVKSQKSAACVAMVAFQMFNERSYIIHEKNAYDEKLPEKNYRNPRENRSGKTASSIEPI